MKAIVIFAIIALLSVSGCNDNPTKFDQVKDIGAQERIIILDNELSIMPRLYRDFMPTIPPSEKPMYVFINVYDINSLVIPENITADYVWLFSDDLSWGGSLNKRTDRNTADSLFFGNGDGPKWDPHVKIDVYVRVKSYNKYYYIKAENIGIFVTS